jgi:ABC-type polysaccharide/polyol phosphate transport system ATPase subunit
MSGEVAIVARSVGKTYRIWSSPGQRLLSPLYAQLSKGVPGPIGRALSRKASAGYRDFHALQDVNLEVRKGEALGIIGLNGSGKSTLLQIIAGTLRPTTGEVEVRGRVAALLELGSGFNPEFTGRENVYLTASVLGLSRRETDDRFDAIAAFADIGQFIEEPIKTYSSGMTMRLAFAVAAHVDPDILIIDEALSVGDARFQLKCARTIDRFIAGGVTLLFVSHDSTMIKRLCRTAILLNQSRVVYSGHPNDVVNLYSQLNAEGGSEEGLAIQIAALKEKSARLAEKRATTAPPSPDPGLATRFDKLLTDERLHVELSGREFSYGGELGRIREVSISDDGDQAKSWFTSGDRVIVRMTVEAAEMLPEPIFALTIKDVTGMEIYGTNTLFSRQPALPLKAGEIHEVEFRFDLSLMPGNYFLSFGFTHFVGEELVVVHRRYDAIKVEVQGRDRTFGIANLNAVIRSRPQSGTKLSPLP